MVCYLVNYVLIKQTTSINFVMQIFVCLGLLPILNYKLLNYTDNILTDYTKL